VTNVLPEDVWHALHPPKLRRPFSILFELTPDPRRITPSAGSEMRTNVILIFFALAIFANIPAGITMAIVSDDKTPATMYLLYLGLWGGIPFVIASIACLKTWLFMRTILKADQELVARLTDWEKEWSNVLLFKGGDPTVAVGEGRVKLSEKDFQNLGGVGGHVRAWTNRDGTKREIRAMPSGLV
jgi:hypothetical protein